MGKAWDTAMLPISVIVPVHNRVALLRQALESVFSQTKQPQEVIVVDDGSTESIAPALTDLDVRLIRQPHCGPSVARNQALDAARSQWVAFLDSDDLWEPSKLERQWDAVVAHAADVCFTDLVMFSDSDIVTESAWRPLGSPPNRHVANLRNAYTIARQHARVDSDVATLSLSDVRLALAGYNIAFPSTLMLRRDLSLAIGGFTSKLWIAEDWDFLLRLSRRKIKVVAIESPLVRYRVHSSNLSDDFVEAARMVIEMVSDAFHRPDEYPEEVRRHWYIHLPTYAISAGVDALRGGRFDAARSLFFRSYHLAPSVLLASWLAFAVILDTPVGRGLYDAAKVIKQIASLVQ